MSGLCHGNSYAGGRWHRGFFAYKRTPQVVIAGAHRGPGCAAWAKPRRRPGKACPRCRPARRGRASSSVSLRGGLDPSPPRVRRPAVKRRTRAALGRIPRRDMTWGSTIARRTEAAARNALLRMRQCHHRAMTSLCYNVTRCCGAAPFTAPVAIVASNVTRRPPYVTASASRYTSVNWRGPCTRDGSINR